MRGKAVRKGTYLARACRTTLSSLASFPASDRRWRVDLTKDSM